ncbi:hypothetical protein BUALT_Bualt09G0045500 [Buddleja alternifolia]|uniref:Uncharacterized protein n=1 Tax=Buddleja alternifolia TaxID=168488 RepID=A0AAV6X759_9LAMI|nr:hypothetical protein BUALT_Bualt09G0045500 [Buddleja alternifolia]
MEELQRAYRSAMSQAQESTAKLTSFAASLDKNKSIDSSAANSSSSAAATYSADQSRLLLARPPRQFVSLWTCSKLCAICFVAGVVVGYTLKRRVRRWASRLLRRLKDD